MSNLCIGTCLIEPNVAMPLVGSVVSNTMHLQCGVSQSSVLGPCKCIFAKPIGESYRRHNFSHQNYANDTQVYLVIKPLDNWENISRRLETCLSDVSVWMSSTMFKLNKDKTELIVFARNTVRRNFQNVVSLSTEL